MGPAEQRTETPLQTASATPVIQVQAQSTETPSAPERYGPKRSSRALAPGTMPFIWPQSRGPQIGSENAARTLRLPLGLIANRAEVTPAASTPRPVPPEISTCGSARARGLPLSIRTN